MCVTDFCFEGYTFTRGTTYEQEAEDGRRKTTMAKRVLVDIAITHHLIKALPIFI